MDFLKDEEHRKGRKQRKENHRQKVKKKIKSNTRRYISSGYNESETNLDLENLRQLNYLFSKAFDYRTYRLRNQDSDYTSQVAQKIAKQQKRLNFEMVDTTLTGDYLIVIIELLQGFKIAFDQNGFPTGAAIRLL